MSVARHHAEWLQLVDVSGAFLSLPVLTHKLPNGLPPLDRDLAEAFRLTYDEWLDGRETEEAAALDEAWIDFVLQRLLDYEDEVLRSGDSIDASLRYVQREHAETLVPDHALVERANQNQSPVRLLVTRWPTGQHLDGPPESGGWAASPEERMITLCRATDVRLGLVTNGGEWMLVDAPVGRGVTTAKWHASDWRSEPLSLRAFIACLGVERFFEDDDHTLEALLDDALTRQQEVTAQLGNQVRRAVEVLVQAIDRVNLNRGGTLLEGVEPKLLYDGALTVMMRLVFLLAAEERDLLLLGDPTYDQHYAVSTLRGQLREAADQQGLQVLERRTDAWVRLLSTFRAVYSGIDHERLRLPPLGGSLFDPDRFPFLEGRERGTSWHDSESRPLPIDNRTVLHLLEAIQLLRLPGSGGFLETQRLSFRGLDVEQIGHVYEGLLDHTAIRVDEPTLGLRGTQRLEPEVGISALEEASRVGASHLVERLRELTGRSSSAIENDLARHAGDDQRIALRLACANNDAVSERMLPYFHLLRTDVWGAPQVYMAGSFVVTSGNARGETGTHYTPRSLTEQIVAETLEPLVYEGPSEGHDRADWRLCEPRALLDLKICDPAMGSGAFLVRVCEWLAERLVESWAHEESEGRVIAGTGNVANDGGSFLEALPASPDERLLHARRLVAERCLYGVDINPMAVELAKLALWLVTMARGRPFGFLDHNLRCGDSLLGVHHIDQLRHMHIHPDRGERLHTTPLFDLAKDLQSTIDGALETRCKIGEINVRDITDVQLMARLDASAKSALENLRFIADGVIGAALATGLKETALDALMADELDLTSRWLQGDRDAFDRITSRHAEWLGVDLDEPAVPRRPFHWAVEFPEVFTERGGFDGFVGNPPFLGGQRLTGTFGEAYREYLVNHIAEGRRGSTDLVAYFFLRVHDLLRPGGTFGLLAVNTIAEGDTRQVGLEPILADRSAIFAAYPNEAWPGQAAVVTSRVHLIKGAWGGSVILSGQEVPTISAFLTGVDEWTPMRLHANKGIAYIGSYVLGMGFTLREDEAHSFIEANSDNAKAIFPYVNGKDLNSHPEQRASRWIINFFDWPLTRDADGSWGEADQQTKSQWLKHGRVPDDFPGHVASDFRELLEVVQEKVKPERDDLSGSTSTARRRRERWWLYASDARSLYHAIGMDDLFWKRSDATKPRPVTLRHVIAWARVSKYFAPTFISSNCCFSDQVVVAAVATNAMFGLLESCVHTEWAWKQSSRLETRLRYTPSDILETFPFPLDLDESTVGRPAERFHAARADYMRHEDAGLTKFNNVLHSPDEHDSRIDAMRAMQVEIDIAVCDAYGWGDIEFDHDFHEVDYLPENDNVRFTICRSARLELLRRLSDLNRERYDEEIRQGKQIGRAAKKSKTKAATKKNAPKAERERSTNQGTLDL